MKIKIAMLVCAVAAIALAVTQPRKQASQS